MTATVIPEAIRPRLAQLVRLISSPVDGEVLAACRALSRTLGGVGLDIHVLADAVEHPPAPMVVYRDRPDTGDIPEWARPRTRPRQGDVVLDFGQRCAVVAALRRGLTDSRMSAWEVEFALSIVGRLNGGKGRLSAKQGETLKRLLDKIGEGLAWV